MALAVLSLLAGCQEKIDGPAPSVTSVVSSVSGTHFICTCDALSGCLKEQNDVLTLSGSGFAPLPVNLLAESAMLLPTVVFKAPTGAEFKVDGEIPANNPAGVRIDYKDDATLLVTLTPAFVKDWPIGKYSVTVHNPNGQSGVLTDGLEVTYGPVLDSVTPSVVCSDIDTKITLKGKNFRPGAKVMIDDKEITPVTFKDSETLEVTVAKGHATGKFDVSVINPEGCATTKTDVLEVVPPPTVTKVSPNIVCTGGLVTITGTGFRPGATVTIGSTTLSGSSVTVTSSTTITVSVGPMPPGGPYDVTVRNPDGCSSKTLPSALTVVPGPIIVAVDPSTVYSKVSFPIAIFGSGFKTGSIVTADASPPVTLTVTAVASGRIDALVPANSLQPGTYDITVKDPGGCSYTLRQALTVTDKLTVRVCGIDPSFGYYMEDTDVTITSGTGTGCSTGTTNFTSTPRAWLNVGGTLKALKAVGFVTSTSLTGTVPAGLTPSTTAYDLLVQNPDGGIGLKQKAFRVVDKAVPLIQSINPGDVTTKWSGTLTINGKNFRAPVKVEILWSSGQKNNLSGPTVVSSEKVTVALDVATLVLLPGAYLVRLTNTDQGTYYDYSALAVTNPSGNLGTWSSTSTTLNTARRRHGMVAGRISAAARYLYVIGGDAGGKASSPFSSVELVPLDKYGATGTWITQRYGLNAPRTGLGALAQGKYIYVIGGEGSSGVLKSVERAMILSPSDAPEISSYTFSLGGTLKKGAWYYRVSATMQASDKDNPGGETLPSDPVVIHAIDNVQATLNWKAVTGAATYNVYRNAAANGAVGKEQLLADGLTATTYTDTGGAIKNANQTPLIKGSTGKFVTVGSALGTARSDAAVTSALDPSGNRFVYVAGGQTSASAALDSVEYASLSADGATLGSFTRATSSLLSKRSGAMLGVGHNATSPLIPKGTTYLYVAGGWDGSSVANSGSRTTAASGGKPGSWTAVAQMKNKPPFAAVGWMVNDTFYYFGGSTLGTTASNLSFSCLLKSTTVPDFANCNSLAAAALPAATMHAALALESAYFYISGGGASSALATKTVIKTVY
jgi:hypothetical protein